MLAAPKAKPGVLHYVRSIAMMPDAGAPVTREQHDAAVSATYSKDIFTQQVWYTVTPTAGGVKQTFAFGRERVYLGLLDLYHTSNGSELSLILDSHGAWRAPADLTRVPVSAMNGIYGTPDQWFMRVVHLLPENRPYIPDVPVRSGESFDVATVREIRSAAHPIALRVTLKGTASLSEASESGAGPARQLTFVGEEVVQGAGMGGASRTSYTLEGTWLLDATTGSVIESQVAIAGQIPVFGGGQENASQPIRALIVTSQLSPDQFAEELPAPEAYPHVLGCFPFNGASAVDPALQEFRVYFDKPMYTGHSTFRRQGFEFCLLDSRVNRDWYAGRVCVFPMRLNPAAQCGMVFNPQQFQSFREANRRLTAPTAEYSFRVAASTEKADPYASRLALSEEVFLEGREVESIARNGSALELKLSPEVSKRVASSHVRNAGIRLLREDQRPDDPLKAAIVLEGRILAYGPVALSNGQSVLTVTSEATPEDTASAAAAIERKAALTLRWVVGEFHPRPLIKLIAEAGRQQPFYQPQLPDLPLDLTPERAVALFQKRGEVLWQQADPYDKNLLWIGFEQYPVVFDVAEKRCKEFPKLFDYDLIRPSAALFLPNETWMGTDKGLLILERAGQTWRRITAGGTDIEANVTGLSLEGENAVRVVIRTADGTERTSLYNRSTQEWKNP